MSRGRGPCEAWWRGQGYASAHGACSSDPPKPRPFDPPLRATACTHLSTAFLLPLVGRTDSAEGRARRGSPGIGLLVEAGRRDISRRGKRQAIRQASAPAADTAECFVDKALHARRPPPRSAFGRVGPPPQGGRGGAHARSCVHPVAATPGEDHPLPSGRFLFAARRISGSMRNDDGTCRSRSVERMDEDFSVAGVMSRTGRRPAASGGLDP